MSKLNDHASDGMSLRLRGQGVWTLSRGLAVLDQKTDHRR